MIDLKNIQNPDEKIKNIVKEFIKNRRQNIDKINNDIDSIQKQSETGSFYTPLKSKPVFTIDYVGFAIASIISDILYGFGQAVKVMKKDAIEINKQRGGVEPQSSPSIDDVTQQADQLTNSINQAQNKTDKIANQAKQSSLGKKNTSIAKQNYSKMTKLGETAFKTGLLWTEKFIDLMLTMALDFSGYDNIANIPWQQLSPELNKKLILIAALLKELSENPATREAVREIAQAVAITLGEIMDEIRPEVNQITDQALDMLTEISEKSVRGATSTGFSIIQAFLAEIPWIGGIIDFFLAIGKGFNAFMETFKVFVGSSGQLGVQGAKTFKNTENTIEEGKDRISNAYDNAIDKIGQSDSNIDSQSGGGISNKKLQTNINKSSNRLSKSIYHFRKTLPKQKFTIHKKNKLFKSSHKKNTIKNKSKSKSK